MEGLAEQVENALDDANARVDEEHERAIEAEQENADIRQAVIELTDTVEYQEDEIANIYEDMERWRANQDDHERTLAQLRTELTQQFQAELAQLRQSTEEQMSVLASNQDRNSSSQPPLPADQAPPSENPEAPNSSDRPAPAPPPEAPPINPDDAGDRPVPRPASRFRLT